MSESSTARSAQLGDYNVVDVSGKTAAMTMAIAAVQSTCTGGTGLEVDRVIGFRPAPSALFYHPNGAEILHLAGAAVVVASLTDPHQQRLLHAHGMDVTCLALSSSGRLAASGEAGGSGGSVGSGSGGGVSIVDEFSDIVVWDVAARRVLYRLSEHDGGVSAVAFSHDERLLLTTGGGKLACWDMSTGWAVAVADCAPTPVAAAWGGFVRDVKRRDTDKYLFATAAARILLWSLDPYSGELHSERLQLASTVREVTALEFSADREALVAATTSGDFLVVAVRSRTVIKSIPACRLGVTALCRLGLGMVVGGGDGTVAIFNNSWDKVAAATLCGGTVALSAAADGSEIVAGTGSGRIYRLRPPSETKQAPTAAPSYSLIAPAPAITAPATLSALLLSESHTAAVNCVAYPPAISHRFITASADGTVRVWDTADYSVVAMAIVRDAGEPLCLCASQEMVISGWNDGCIRSHEADTMKQLWCIDDAHQDGVTAVVLSRNQRFVVTGGHRGEVRVWEVRSRELVSHLKQHGQRVAALALYSDDAHVLSVSRDRSLVCWDLRAEKQVAHHSQRMGGINAVAVSRDHTIVLTAGQEKRASLWDLRYHDPVAVVNLSPEMNDEARTLAVSPCGTFFATGGSACVLKLWSIPSSAGEVPTLLAEGRGHSGHIRALQISPDGRQVTTAGADGSILVWNVYR